MVKDAEQHADEDQKRREAVETKNMAENMVYQTEKLLKEQGDKVAADKKAKVEAAVEELKKAIKADDADEMKAKMEALNTEMQAVSAELYAQAKAPAQARTGRRGERGRRRAAGGAAESRKKQDEGEVIDADFEMVDDDKKQERKRTRSCRPGAAREPEATQGGEEKV